VQVMGRRVFQLNERQKAELAGLPNWRRRLCRLGELHAALFYESLGYKVAERNWRAGRFGEIDLIVRGSSGETVFCEVKSRCRPGATGKPGSAGDSCSACSLEAAEIVSAGFAAIGPRKRRRIVTTARVYLARHEVGGVPYRFDALVLAYDLRAGWAAEATCPQPEIIWVSDAFFF